MYVRFFHGFHQLLQTVSFKRRIEGLQRIVVEGLYATTSIYLKPWIDESHERIGEVFHSDSVSIFISFEINLLSEPLLNFFKQGFLVFKTLCLRGRFLHRDCSKHIILIVLLQRSQKSLSDDIDPLSLLTLILNWSLAGNCGDTSICIWGRRSHLPYFMST